MTVLRKIWHITYTDEEIDRHRHMRRVELVSDYVTLDFSIYDYKKAMLYLSMNAVKYFPRMSMSCH